jgi:ATP-dependent helicase HrpB
MYQSPAVKKLLPIDPVLPRVIAHLRDHRNLVLVATPGAGKTTRVPPALLDAGLLPPDRPNLVMLQPRRVAARATAEWIAQENGWTLGREVGYHVRFDRKLTRDTRLRVITEGILTRQLVDDPYLDTVGCVILDEFHERSLHSDIAIALLRELQLTVRDDLMLIVMSATIEAGPVAAFLGDCPVVQVEGRTHPVEIVHLGPGQPSALPDRVVAALEHLTAGNEAGDVLVFLPGAEEIRRTQSRLESLARRHDLLLLPLYGSLGADEQMRALRPANQRKVVLATNIAETSLTIDGVTTVIDSGLARVASYDPQRGLDRLDLSQISKASATQRAGRAGRTAPGRCLRLWSAREHLAMDDFDAPEVRRVDLAATVLALHAWGYSDPRTFGWYEPPPDEALQSAEQLLSMLGALEAGKITPLGPRMLALPVHPRLARLLIGAAEAGRLEDGAAIAALLSEKDITLPPQPGPGPRAPTARGDSDLLIRLERLAEAQRDRFSMRLRDRDIDPLTARRVAQVRDELLRAGRDLQSRVSDDRDILLKLPLLAYPDRVVRRRGAEPRSGVMVGGGGVRLAAESVVWKHEFFVALDARHDARSIAQEALVRLASGIEPAWLEQLFPGSIRRERGAVFDEQRGRVVGRGATYYRDLLLREDHDAVVDAATASRVLAEYVTPARARQLLQLDDHARAWLARLALLVRAMPDQPWPRVDDDAVLREVVDVACRGKRSLDELPRALLSALQDMLQYPLDRMLDTEAPETIEVPSGSRIRLEYPQQSNADAIQPPVLAVRLQEIFGWIDTPRVAGGRVAVLLQLLAPNFRPVQITHDLRSFWSSTYFQVRKDLRTRYPKHAWPEDPLGAIAQARGRHQPRGPRAKR